MIDQDEKESLTLKWGSIKGWDNIKPATRAILKRWTDLGVSMSAMSHRDTPEQKLIICEAIDAVVDGGGEIWDDWNGGTLTKEEARAYVMEYGA